jgi:hypothetical protein
MQNKKHSHHTPMYKALCIPDGLCKVDPIARLRPRILIIIDELMAIVNIMWHTMLGPCHIDQIFVS